MSKDPAFLFYSADFLVGTLFMTMEERGIYISLLCYQHQHGGNIKKSVFNHMVGSHDLVREKFTEDDDGFHNTRLKDEAEKRKKYCKSRNNNKLGKNQHSAKEDTKRSHDLSCLGHMENEDVNVFNNVKYIHTLFDTIWDKYPNKDGKKLAVGYFKRTVRCEKDWDSINTALKNYLLSDKVLRGYVKNGSTWFNNWEDWVKDPVTNVSEEIALKKKQAETNKKLQRMGL